jgi:hypothetical protein
MTTGAEAAKAKYRKRILYPLLYYGTLLVTTTLLFANNNNYNTITDDYNNGIEITDGVVVNDYTVQEEDFHQREDYGASPY